MKAQVCPYLGMRDDPETVFSYPSPANHCFRAVPDTVIKLDHQREFCLSDKHPLCHVYRGEPDRSKKRFKHVAHRSRQVPQWIRNSLVWLFPSMIVMASIIGLVLFYPGEALTPFNSGIPSPSSTMVMLTPPILIVHALDIPIGTQYPLVIHRVRTGETLSSMAMNFNTTEEAITSLNYNLFLPLWTNAVIVIPLNQNYVNNLPLFETYQVTESLSLQTLADRFSIDIEMLMVYNLVDPEYVFTVGEWVLIPHSRLATPTR